MLRELGLGPYKPPVILGESHNYLVKIKLMFLLFPDYWNAWDYTKQGISVEPKDKTLNWSGGRE